jgi:hypothetical protein
VIATVEIRGGPTYRASCGGRPRSSPASTTSTLQFFGRRSWSRALSAAEKSPCSRGRRRIEDGWTPGPVGHLPDNLNGPFSGPIWPLGLGEGRRGRGRGASNSPVANQSQLRRLRALGAGGGAPGLQRQPVPPLPLRRRGSERRRTARGAPGLQPPLPLRRRGNERRRAAGQ